MRINKKIFFLVITFFILNSTYGQKVKHVVLISLDGSRPEFYMDDSNWEAPNLQKLRKEGAFASEGAESVFPSLTWPAHTSIITGENPGKHGILYNKPADGREGQGYWYYSYIQTKTIFDAIKEAGMTSGAVWWPVLASAPVDYNFPVRRPEKTEVRYDKLSIREPYINPPILLEEVEKKIGRKFTEDDLEFNGGRQGKLVTEITNHIIQEYQPNFLALHLGDMDHAQHVHGTSSEELKEAVKFNDSLVGSILNTISDAGIENSTVVIITGDHGHTNTKSIFAPNTYLKKKKIINEYGWKAKFQAAGGSAFLYLKNPKDNALLDSVRNILKETTEYKDGLFRVIERSELDAMSANPDASLALAMKEGVSVTNSDKGKALRVQKKPFKSTHGYDPKYRSMQTAFLVKGSEIKYKDVKKIKLTDIAPFIAELLDLNFTTSSDNKVLHEIIRD